MRSVLIERSYMLKNEVDFNRVTNFVSKFAEDSLQAIVSQLACLALRTPTKMKQIGLSIRELGRK